MLAAQITPEERTASKEIARRMGMTYAGWLGLLIKREIRNSSGTVVDPAISGEIRGSVTL